MKQTRGGSFLKQAAILGIAAICVRFIGFLYRIPAHHLVGDEGNALYAWAYNIYTFAIIISSGALPAAISKLVSERIALGQHKNANLLFNTAMKLALFLGSIVGLAVFIGADWLATIRPYPQSVLAIRFLAPTVVIVSILAVFRGNFQGQRNAMPTALSQIGEQIFNVVFSLLLAFIFFDASDLGPAVAGLGAGTGIGAVVALLIVAGIHFAQSSQITKTNNGYFTESRFDQVKDIIKTATPIIIGMSIYIIANIIDMGMAADRIYASGAFTEAEVRGLVGQFTGKFILLTTLPVSLSMALSQAIIPEIAAAHVTGDSQAVRHKTNMALRLSMMLSIPSAIALAVMADPILRLLFPRFPDGGLLLQFGSASIIFLAMVQVLTGVLQGIGHMGLPIVGAFFGVLVKIPVNYFLMAVPEINILGAVISTILCYVVAAVVNITYLYQATGIIPDVKDSFIKPLIAASAMGLVLYAVYNTLTWVIPSQVATIFALGVGAVTYVIFMFLIKGLKTQDINSAPLPSKVKSWFSGL